MENQLSIRDLRIGDVVQNKRTKFPMNVVGLHADGLVELDFEGNEGGFFEEEVKDLELCVVRPPTEIVCLVALMRVEHKQLRERIDSLRRIDPQEDIVQRHSIKEQLFHMVAYSNFLKERIRCLEDKYRLPKKD